MPDIDLAQHAKDVTPKGNGRDGDGYELLSEADIAALPAPSWLIDPLLTDQGLAALIGPYGSGKSFLALDMALNIAHGRHWQDRRTRPGSVIYLAGEGVGGLRNRVQAWRQHHRVTDQGAFHLIRDTVNLLERAHVEKLISTLEPLAPISLVVVDTLARAFVGGDENSAMDMGLFIAACDRVRAATKGAALIVHHTGKDGGKGARGSTAFMGAVDTALEASGSGVVTLKTTKQKDAEPAPPIFLKLEVVDLGMGEDNQPITSCVPIYCEAPKINGAKLSDVQENILTICKQAGAEGIANADWFKTVTDLGITERRQTFNNATLKFASMGLVTRDGDRWVAAHK